MKHLKTYKIFEMEMVTDEKDSVTKTNALDRLKKYNTDMSEYQSKKKSIDNIVLNNKDNKDVSKQVEDIIGDNRLLSYYLPIVYIKKQIMNSENKIKYDNGSKTGRINDVNSLGGLTDQKDKKIQSERLKQQISDIDIRIQDNTTKLNLLKSQLNKEESELKKKIDLGKKDIEDIIKSIK